ncbi:PIN domain-containing protein [Kocuria sp. CH-021]|uniref:PIN domain-containing protein n=1 Tax=Kocuria sp. CH-021 TaxID=3406735 RepID=UPI003C72263D
MLAPLTSSSTANVLFSRACRDWIARGALLCREGMFVPHWTEDVLSEWMYRLRRKNPTAPDSSIGQKRRDLEGAFPQALVTGYAIMDSPFADPNDAHVHAAAVQAGVDMVITQDSGFHAVDGHVLDDLPYEVWTPDDFLVLMADSSPGLLFALVEDQLGYWSRRSPGDVDLPGRLRAAQLCQFASQVEEVLRTMAMSGRW